MARRTKRPTVVWLPLDINNRIQLQAASTDGADSAGFQFGILVPSGGPSATTLIPLVKDEPQNITGATETLADLEGSAYRLRRIVGKIHIQPAQIAAVTNLDSTTFMVTVGMIVLHVDNAGVQLAASASYDVQALDSTRDPWIWRRSWVLQNQVGNAALNVAAPDTRPLSAQGANTTGYGSGNMDGPHIDAKTARVISNEERLFMVASAIGLDGNTQGAAQPIIGFCELRVLASMRKQAGNRRNASR